MITHFNQADHSVKNIKFFIFKDQLEELNNRLNLELQLIHLFLKLEIPLLNEKIPSIYSAGTETSNLVKSRKFT